jgi:hypothetical protein
MMVNGALNELVNKAREQREAFAALSDAGGASPNAQRAAAEVSGGLAPAVTAGGDSVEAIRHWIAERPRTAVAIAAVAGALLASRATRPPKHLQTGSAPSGGAVSKGVLGLALAPVLMQFAKQRLLPMGVQWAITQAVRNVRGSSTPGSAPSRGARASSTPSTKGQP